MLDKNKKPFLMGFQFDFKKAWMLLFFLVIPFIFFSFRSIKQYNYYVNEQPSYQSLITVHGRIIADNRAPPEPYNKRHDGIISKQTMAISMFIVITLSSS